jgi:hypothetical protein
MAMPGRLFNVVGTLPATAASHRLMNIEATEPPASLFAATIWNSSPSCPMPALISSTACRVS